MKINNTIRIVIIAVGLLFTTSLAQTDDYVGAMLGYPFTVVYGVDDALGVDADLRFHVGLMPFGGLGFNGGAAALFKIDNLDDSGQFTAYGGGGLDISYINYSSYYGISNASITWLNVLGIVGLDYKVNNQIAFFGEIGTGLGLAIARAYSITASAFVPAGWGGIGLRYIIQQ